MTQTPVVSNTNIIEKKLVTQAFTTTDSQVKRAQIEKETLNRILKLPTRVPTITAQSRMRMKGFLNL